MEAVYTPPKILRRLIDYYLRQKVVEELKTKQPKVVNWFNIVLIELKQQMTLKRYGRNEILDYPKYEGKMYNYEYALPSHNKVLWYFENPHKKKSYRFYGYTEVFDNIHHPVVAYGIQHTIKEVYEWDINKTDEQTIKEIKNVLNTKCKRIGNTYMELVCDNLTKRTYTNTTVPTTLKPYLIKMRFESGKMDLKQTPRTYYNPLNLKYWNKETMKTSNKGLIADTTYSWSESFGRGGWKFGGISADDIETICKINGFPVEKETAKNGKPKDKKYQYGDYANWYLHSLL